MCRSEYHANLELQREPLSWTTKAPNRPIPTKPSFWQRILRMLGK